MKKLFHPGIIAILVITVASCSKSSTELIAKDKTSKSEQASPSQGKFSPSPNNNVPGMSDFYRLIYQPVKMELGQPGSNLSVGEFAVFYVELDPAFANDPASSAILTTRDDDTGDDIQTYDLISYKFAGSYEIKVPDALQKKPFMFAIVELDDQYTDKSVALHSEITVNNATSVAQIDHAFNCKTGIIAE
jgi:hypothetical protein